MFCSICREVEGGGIGRKMNVFVKSTTNLKLETMKDHETSKSHRVACLKSRNKKNLIQNTPVGLALTALTIAKTDRIKLLMRNLHAIIKKCSTIYGLRMDLPVEYPDKVNCSSIVPPSY